MNLKDKVRGTFLGLAIGDALGKPAESLLVDGIRDREMVMEVADRFYDKLTTRGND